MEIELDTEIKLEEKDTAYMVVSYHRNSSLPSKSRWTISREQV
ncbi:hypothetical protein [Fulvivirga ulvae]|nr:hypothetical protein [Fulvivirga ulvae]